MLLDLFLLFAAAKVAGEIFARMHQPQVVGEILVGVLLGPSVLGLVGSTEFLDLFAELGVVFLLFTVGLETNPTELWRVGRQSAAVGVLGVIAPFGLGYLLMRMFGRPMHEALFVGTALTATSVGITARVLSDLGRIRTVIARVILGAAVFDDILGMLVLAIISGMAAGGLSYSHVAVITVEATAFCVLAVLIGRPAVQRLTPRFAREVQSARQSPVFGFAIALCLALSALASVIGLAAIIGAFFAGILFAETRESEHLRTAMAPIYELLVPIFFVIVGLRVELAGLLAPQVLSIALLMTLVAIVGKLLGCGLAALPSGLRSALAVGVGMVPRGEVGLVVAAIGLSRAVITEDVYTMVVLMCILTSVVAPPVLRIVLRSVPTLPEEGPAGEGRP